VNRCDSSWIGGGNPQLTTSFALLELVGNFSRCFRTLLVYFGHSMVSGWVPMLTLGRPGVDLGEGHAENHEQDKGAVAMAVLCFACFSRGC
jgi:hypothetical protein